MKFSDRIGITKQTDVIQRNGIDDTLKNKLWNILFTYLIIPLQNDNNVFLINTVHYKFFVNLWHNYFGKPVDTIPHDKATAISQIRSYFFECKWYEIYNLIDFVIRVNDLFDNNKFRDSVNIVLETELSAYRFIGEELVLVEDGTRISETEVKEMDNGVDEAIAQLEATLNVLKNSRDNKVQVSTEDMISAMEPYDLDLPEDNQESNPNAQENTHDIIESTKSVKVKLGLRSEDRDAFLTLKSNPVKASGEVKKEKDHRINTKTSSETIVSHNNHISHGNKSVKSEEDETSEKKDELDRAIYILKQKSDLQVQRDNN